MARRVAIVPAILEKEFAGVKDKIRRAEGICDWVQIDIADGTFEPNETWRNPEDLKNLHPDIKIEMHLMVADPQAVVTPWIDAGAARIVTHWEAFQGANEEVDRFLKTVRDHDCGVGLSVHPETSADVLVPYLAEIDLVLFLSVEPGFSGQPFVENVINKVRAFHGEHPEVIIAVDGGMNPKRAKRMADAGASIINSGSSLWSYSLLEDGIAAFRNQL